MTGFPIGPAIMRDKFWRLKKTETLIDGIRIFIVMIGISIRMSPKGP